MAEPDFPKLRSGIVIELPGAGRGSGLMTSCLNCRYFDERGESYNQPHAVKSYGAEYGEGRKHEPEMCTKFKARPPARVIAFGCKDYEDEDSIPF